MHESSSRESVPSGALLASPRVRIRKACAWLLGACGLFGTGYAGLHASQTTSVMIPIDIGAWPNAADAGALAAAPAPGTAPTTAKASATANANAPTTREVPIDAGVPEAGSVRLGLNHATATDLQRLPGIGAKRANAILELRTRLGQFRRVEDLLRIRGIGKAMLKRLRPLVEVD